MASGILSTDNISQYTYINENGNLVTAKPSVLMQRSFQAVWYSDNDHNKNESIINWTVYARSPGSSLATKTECYHVVFEINGNEVYNSDNISDMIMTQKNEVLAEGTYTIAHNENGTQAVDMSLEGYVFVDKDETYSRKASHFDLTPNPMYTLTIVEDIGSEIKVEKTYCADNTLTGYNRILESGDELYYGDMLKITSHATSEHYSVRSQAVNGMPCVNGGTWTVSSDVVVSNRTAPVPSEVSASDGYIDLNLKITLNKHSVYCTHTLTYSFEGATGTIITQTADTEITWHVPYELYAQIPNSKYGICEIKCITYYNEVAIGENTCEVKLTAAIKRCGPELTFTAEDINEATLALTGDPLKYIRYRSNVQCTLDITPRGYATITEKYINNQLVTDDVVVYEGVNQSSYTGKVKDSRGYTTTYSALGSSLVPYIPLTCNPTVNRLTMAEETVVISVRGNFYSGSFGLHNNTLRLQYRYSAPDEPVGEWQDIDTTNIAYGTSSYYSTQPIALNSNFSYSKEYQIEIRATDGASGIVLSEEIRTLPIMKFIPVFDWGETGFNFNVPITLYGQELDYIVDQGTSNGWTYRKWNSGVAEAWKTISAQGINPASRNLNGFYYSDEQVDYLPTELGLQSIAYCSASGGSIKNMNFIRPFIWNTEHVRWILIGGAPEPTNVDVMVNLEVKGRWK